MTKRIDAYSLAEFMNKVEEAYNEGYRVDFTTNENYPQAFGSHYTVGMVKQEVSAEVPKEVPEVKTEPDTSTEVPTTKRKRNT
jgi:hypothetical protein